MTKPRGIEIYVSVNPGHPPTPENINFKRIIFVVGVSPLPAVEEEIVLLMSQSTGEVI